MSTASVFIFRPEPPLLQRAQGMTVAEALSLLLFLVHERRRRWAAQALLLLLLGVHKTVAEMAVVHKRWRRWPAREAARASQEGGGDARRAGRRPG